MNILQFSAISPSVLITVQDRHIVTISYINRNFCISYHILATANLLETIEDCVKLAILIAKTIITLYPHHITYTKLIGQPAPEISSFKIFEMVASHHI